MGYLTTGIEPKDRAGGAKFGVSINESEKWGRYAQRNSLATLCDCREKKGGESCFLGSWQCFCFCFQSLWCPTTFTDSKSKRYPLVPSLFFPLNHYLHQFIVGSFCLRKFACKQTIFVKEQFFCKIYISFNMWRQRFEKKLDL